MRKAASLALIQHLHYTLPRAAATMLASDDYEVLPPFATSAHESNTSSRSSVCDTANITYHYVTALREPLARANSDFWFSHNVAGTAGPAVNGSLAAVEAAWVKWLDSPPCPDERPPPGARGGSSAVRRWWCASSGQHVDNYYVVRERAGMA